MKNLIEPILRFILLQLILAFLNFVKLKRRRKMLPPWIKEKLKNLEQILKKREIDISLNTLFSVLSWIIDIIRGGI